MVFGSAGGFPAELDLADLLVTNGGDGSLGFVLKGIDPSDYSGVSVSSAGDVNCETIHALILGAYDPDPNGNS